MRAKGRSLLVFNAKFASVFGEESAGAKRLRRYFLQAVARELLPENRIAECLRGVVPGKTCVNVHYSEKYKRAHYGNLIQCASVWTCPVCAAKITERRRLELQDGLDRSPWPGTMVTLTFQHDRIDKLAELLRDFNHGRRRLKAGWWWQEFSKRWGITGTITALEVTYSLAHGWHVHSHELYLVDGLPDTGAMRAELSERFEAVMRGLGRYVSPRIGVHVRATTHAAADYISKWGAASELSKATVKQGKESGHYSPFDLLYLYAAEEKAWAGEAFQEFAAAMRGANQIRWSKGLRKLLGMAAVASDQELVEAPEESDRLLAQLTLAQWGVILKRGRRGELLEVASTGSAAMLRAWLMAQGVTLES